MKRFWTKAAFVSIPLFSSLSAGCKPLDVPDPEANGHDFAATPKKMDNKALIAAAPAAKALADAQNRLGLSLLRGLGAAKPRENVFVSPTSVFLALAMTENGAAHQTKAELRRALFLPPTAPAGEAAAFVALQKIFAAQGAQIDISNALWADQTTPLAPKFIQNAAKTFGAGAQSLDFKAHEATAATVNAWVKDKTRGKIADILSASDVPDSGAILTNAIYFEGRWQHEFPKDKTKDEPFHLPGGAEKMVPLMARGGFDGVSGSHFSGARLPYENSTCEMIVLLPDATQTAGQILEKLDLSQLAPQKSPFEADVRLPRFSLDYKASLGKSLQKLGLKTAFSNADFGPMSLPDGSFISDVLHKTRLEEDETGTIAAAATEMAAKGDDEDEVTKTLIFDRPFVLLLRETRTGALLFAGIVNDPQKLP